MNEVMTIGPIPIVLTNSILPGVTVGFKHRLADAR
jgi:hypothetical protein